MKADELMAEIAAHVPKKRPRAPQFLGGNMTVKACVRYLAAFLVLAGFCVLCADSDSMAAFLYSKVVGGLFCLVGLVTIAHMGEED